MLNDSRTLAILWHSSRPLLVAGFLMLPGCGSDEDGGAGLADAGVGCVDESECGGDTPVCGSSGVCEALPPAHQIGWRDGSPESVGLVEIHTSSSNEVTDISFHPDRPDELWVLRREFESPEPCTSFNPTPEGCAALEGSIVVVFDPGTADAQTRTLRDPNAWHFMRRPSGFAFGDNGFFATSSEARTGNFTDDNIDFNGATLWSSDLDVFGVQPPGGNGSHFDMVHTTPFGMGIAHDVDNVYWVFNGHVGSIDRVDFKEDHGPGMDYHGDAEMLRHAQGDFARLETVPGHLILDRETGWLYIADTGNGRIARLDTDSGVMGAPALPNYESYPVCNHVDGAVVEDFVAAGGVLDAPSGIALLGAFVLVSDNATSQIHAFDGDGELVRSLDTGLPGGSLSGLAVGPDGKVYFADMPAGTVYRIDPK